MGGWMLVGSDLAFFQSRLHGGSQINVSQPAAGWAVKHWRRTGDKPPYTLCDPWVHNSTVHPHLFHSCTLEYCCLIHCLHLTLALQRFFHPIRYSSLNFTDETHLLFLWSRDKMWHVGALGGLGVNCASISSVLDSSQVELLADDLTFHGEHVLARSTPWYAVVGSFHGPSAEDSVWRAFVVAVRGVRRKCEEILKGVCSSSAQQVVG